MKLKLDENLGPYVADIFTRAGHDCHSVLQEKLSGASDVAVLAAAIAEQRVLVTLDRDFGDVLRFPPNDTSGIAILAPKGRLSRKALVGLASGLLKMLESYDIEGKLWIVEPGRIREHERSFDIDPD